ncbi:lysozyme inhibitor LprI family protein [Desulfovibrio sp. OttesenSCG-928-G15]|nr:lysozyme inhibitor LprI family protein [Desulfovibrio sp. OttesenSCG-928-G15]
MMRMMCTLYGAAGLGTCRATPWQYRVLRRAAVCAVTVLLFLTASAFHARATGDDVFHLCSEAPGDFLDSEQGLSVVWQELKSMLPKKQFASLLKEQRAWLKEREKKAGAAGSTRALCDSYARENRKRIAVLERRLPYSSSGQASGNAAGPASGRVPGRVPGHAPGLAPAPAPAPDDWMGQPAPAPGGK